MRRYKRATENSKKHCNHSSSRTPKAKTQALRKTLPPFRWNGTNLMNQINMKLSEREFKWV